MPGIARDRRKALKKDKEKRIIRKTQTATINIFVLLLFHVKKSYFVRKHIWKNVVYIETFV